MYRLPNRSRNGFTLIELLVVIAIIAILIALFGAAVQKVAQAAARAQSTNNLKQLALGSHSYHDSLKYLPFNGTGTIANSANNESGSWGYQILPFVDQDPLYQQQNGTAQAIYAMPLAVFRCPMRNRPGFVSGATAAAAALSPALLSQVRPNVIMSDVVEPLIPGELYAQATISPIQIRPISVVAVRLSVSYHGPTSDYAINPFVNDLNRSVSAANTRRKLVTIADGTSNTILFGHAYVAVNDYLLTTPAVGYRLPIFNGGQLATARNPLGDTPATFLPDGIDATSNQWGSPLSNGGLMAMADGTVRMFPYTTSLQTFLLPTDGVAATLPD